jgi:hypothetical protein
MASGVALLRYENLSIYCMLKKLGKIRQNFRG